MIAQGNAISHGARAIEYSIDKDKARLVKVNDLPENIEPLAMWSRMMQHQHQCMKDRYNPKPITLNALRFEISPAKEESAVNHTMATAATAHRMMVGNFPICGMKVFGIAESIAPKDTPLVA